MSGERPWWVRPLKRLQTWLTHSRPDHFVFESEAMRRTGVVNLGIPELETSVIPIGADVKRFARGRDDGYCSRTFGFPPSRRVIAYSGHFEERKGVGVLARAAIELVDRRGRRDVQFLLAGNRNSDESAPYQALVEGKLASEHVTFAGYRSDLPAVFSSAHMGCIASTGWDSFTVSAIEMQAAGLPVIVSALQGLPEAIIPGETGLTFRPGDHVALADTIEQLLDDPARHQMMAYAAARYASRHCTSEINEARLGEVIRQQFLRNRSRWRRVNAWGAIA